MLQKKSALNFHEKACGAVFFVVLTGGGMRMTAVDFIACPPFFPYHAGIKEVEVSHGCALSVLQEFRCVQG